MSFKGTIEKWKTTGAIAPSSKFLVNKMLAKIDYAQDLDLLQLGFGKGVFTKENYSGDLLLTLRSQYLR